MQGGDDCISRTVGRDTQVAEPVNARYAYKFDFIELLLKILDVILSSNRIPSEHKGVVTKLFGWDIWCISPHEVQNTPARNFGVLQLWYRHRH